MLSYLDTQAEGVDRTTFFPEDGTATGLGKPADRVLIALGRVAVQLKLRCRWRRIAADGRWPRIGEFAGATVFGTCLLVVALLAANNMLWMNWT
ncbi:MAG: hypothetical protein MUF54_01625 [Polyangiaceae bacterium]|nr:hypothetical protein [Polyangiaceae bacterium]